MMTWFRLYHDTPDDIKLRRFTPQEKWAWIALLCLASKSGDRGSILAQDEDIADYCEFNSTQDWLYYRDKLIAKGMLEISGAGTLSILHWSDRQYDKPSSTPEATKERKRRQREREKELKTSVVTPMSRDVTPSHATDTDTYSDPDTNTQPDQEIKEIRTAADAAHTQPHPTAVENFPLEQEPIEVNCSPVVNAEFVSTERGTVKDQGSGSLSKKKNTTKAGSYEAFRLAWNERKPLRFSGMQVVTDARGKVFDKLIRDCGGIEQAIAAFTNALDYARTDSWYRAKDLTFENFASNGKILQLHEKFIERETSNIPPEIDESVVNVAAERQRILRVIGA